MSNIFDNFSRRDLTLDDEELKFTNTTDEAGLQRRFDQLVAAIKKGELVTIEGDLHDHGTHNVTITWRSKKRAPTKEIDDAITVKRGADGVFGMEGKNEKT